MELVDLEELLAELRVIGTDHQTVEAKRASGSLPTTTAETLSAFANTDGGTLLLGVHENAGAFTVTGVEDSQAQLADLQAMCAQLEPPLRPRISVLLHPDGVVLAAQVPSVQRDQRPCHRQLDGPHASSFVRVGDADQRMTSAEVDQLLANRTPIDHSRSPASPDSTLDGAAVTGFLTALRTASPRAREVPNEELLVRLGAVARESTPPRPTLAGLLTLGHNPQQFTAAARLTYRRLPAATDPPDTRHASKHLEGTVGELLDDTMDTVATDLDQVQVMRNGALIDELDIPREALREVLSNALVHRSFAAGQSDISVLVEVSDETVVITSPGGVHVTADPATLGLEPIAGLRNLTLVRLGEQLRTPSGGRIVEQQASGIPAADRACRRHGSMPALFIDRPTTFQVILVRRAVDPAPALERLEAAGVPATTPAVRLVSVLTRLDRLREEGVVSGLGSVNFDARFAARTLAPSSVEAAADQLRGLEDARVLHRRRARHIPAWGLLPGPVQRTPGSQRNPGKATPSAPPPPGRRDDRIPDVLSAIAASPAGLTAKAIGEALRLTSPTSRNRWIRRAQTAGLITSSAENPFDPTATYTLTRKGTAEHARSLPRL